MTLAIKLKKKFLDHFILFVDKPVEIRKPLSKLLKMRMKDPESNINKFNIVDYDIKSLGVPRGPAKWDPLKFPENMFNSGENCKPAIKLPSGIYVENYQIYI